MKKQIMSVNIHSFVDVITNSSTELFVCDTDKSIETVETILREKLKQFSALTDREYVYEECFDPVFIYTQEMADKAIADEYAWGYEGQATVGKIIIESASDNTIPYDLWDRINDLFDGQNHHLG